MVCIWVLHGIKVLLWTEEKTYILRGRRQVLLPVLGHADKNMSVDLPDAVLAEDDDVCSLWVIPKAITQEKSFMVSGRNTSEKLVGLKDIVQETVTYAALGPKALGARKNPAPTPSISSVSSSWSS